MSTKNKSPNNMARFTSPKHSAYLLQQLQFLLGVGENGGLCDVVLIAGKNGQRVPAHRVILAAYSRYFRTMFTGDMLESNASEITLGDDVHGDILLPLIQFCYTGNIEICVETVDELARTAHRLQLNAIVIACSKFMEQHLDASNCLGVAALAELLSLDNLKDLADKHTLKHFVQVSQQEEFLQLSFDRLTVLIASDELRVSSEEEVLHSVISWMRYEMEEEEGKRTKHIAALLTLVRLSVLPQTFLTEHGMIWGLCHEHPVCLPLLKEAFEESNVPIRSRRIKPRKSMQTSLLAVWCPNKKQEFCVAEYSPVKDKWNLFDKTFFSSRYNFAAAFFNSEFIVVGGCNLDDDDRDDDRVIRACLSLGTQSPLKTVESINLETMTSSELPSMRQGRDGHSIAVLEGLLYAVGGGQGLFGRVLESVECYNPNDSKWSDVAPLSVGRGMFGLAVLNGRLFAVGGKTDDLSVISSTECYDPQTDEWTQLADLKRPRYDFSIASGNGYLYAVGGSDEDFGELITIERYDPQVDKWTEICKLSSLRYVVSCVFLDDRLLFLISQKDSGKKLKEYNPLTGTWKELATLPTENRQFELHAVLKGQEF